MITEWDKLWLEEPLYRLVWRSKVKAVGDKQQQQVTRLKPVIKELRACQVDQAYQIKTLTEKLEAIRNKVLEYCGKYPCEDCSGECKPDDFKRAVKEEVLGESLIKSKELRMDSK